MQPSPARVAAAHRKQAAHSRQARLKKVRGLWELQRLANSDPRYALLLKIAAENLGYGGSQQNNSSWMKWLETNAMETGEDGESMVVDEVNFVKDIAEDMIKKNDPEWQAIQASGGK